MSDSTRGKVLSVRKDALVRIKLNSITSVLVIGTTAIAVATAPTASAVDESCVNSGGSTECMSPDNAEIYASPQALTSVGHSGYGPFMGYHHGRGG
jgi:hypothetical protein